MDRFKGGKGAAGVRSFAKGMLQAATLASASTLAFAVLNPAMAQTGPNEDDQRNDKVVVEGTRDRAVETSKVTAPLADTPKSVTVIRGDHRSHGRRHADGCVAHHPGITLGSGEGGVSAGDQPFIRGVDSTNDVFVDSVRDAGVTSREVFNMEQVEVLARAQRRVCGSRLHGRQHQPGLKAAAPRKISPRAASASAQMRRNASRLT